MPKVEAILSRDLVHALETLNSTCIVQAPPEKRDAISKFAGIMISKSRDLDPEVGSLVQNKFWDLV